MTLIGGIPVSRLKEALNAGSDEQLTAFLQSYTLGFGADTFVSAMSPDMRAIFLLDLALKYPEDWVKATNAMNKVNEGK